MNRKEVIKKILTCLLMTCVITLSFKITYAVNEEKEPTTNSIGVSYQAHVQINGWQGITCTNKRMARNKEKWRNIRNNKSSKKNRSNKNRWNKLTRRSKNKISNTCANRWMANMEK